jgi:hypothetical protein
MGCGKAQKGWMRTTIATIQGQDITLYTAPGIEVVELFGDLDIDCDGIGGNPFHDPYFQPDTRYHFEGEALYAEVVPYVVVPPVVLAKTAGRVLGCHCVVTNLRNGKSTPALVGDSGPTFKIGEGSPMLAERLGLDSNPNHGGTSDQIIHFLILVGRPAIVDGIHYTLQSA